MSGPASEPSGTRPRVGIYVHHHGLGHVRRSAAVAAALRERGAEVTLLSSHPALAGADDVVTLPLDVDEASSADPRSRDATAHGALHWVPRGVDGLTARTAAVSAWIARVRPAVVVVDVSVEIALLVRLHGVPVVVVDLPGRRDDAPHALVHRVAELVVVPWPQAAGCPDHLREVPEHRVLLSGGITPDAGRPTGGGAGTGAEQCEVLVLGGTGGGTAGAEALEGARAATPGWNWTALGAGDGAWCDDPWPALVAADVVVVSAGLASVAQVAAAGARAVVLAQPRPFDEQDETVAALASLDLAETAAGWPEAEAWPGLLARARARVPRWERWAVDGAAARVAERVLGVAGAR